MNAQAKPRHKLWLDGSISLVACGPDHFTSVAAGLPKELTGLHSPIDSLREEMEAAGISLAAWCRAHSVSYDIARGVLAGRIKAKRGEAHRIAVALGLKRGRVISAHLYAPPSRPRGKLQLVEAAK